MLDIGVPRRTCIGAVSNEGEDSGVVGGVVEVEGVGTDEFCGSFEGMLEDIGDDSIVTAHGGEDGTFVVDGDVGLETTEGRVVGGTDGGAVGQLVSEGGHRVREE